MGKRSKSDKQDDESGVKIKKKKRVSENADTSIVRTSEEEGAEATAQNSSTTTSNGPMSHNVVDELLNQMEELASRNGHTYRKFDFDKLHVDDMSGAELQKLYGSLRSGMLRSINILKREIPLIREYAKQQWTSSVTKYVYADRPKAPPTAFIRFFMKERKKMLKKHPEFIGEFSKKAVTIIGAKWRALDEEKKKRFREKYKEEKAAYLQQMEEYYLRHPDAKTVPKVPVRTNQNQKPKINLPRKRKPRAPPKKPPPPNAPLDLFMASKMFKYGEKYSLEGEALREKIKSKFEKLSERKRAKWETKAQEEKHRKDEIVADVVNQVVADQMVNGEHEKSPKKKKKKKKKKSSHEKEPEPEPQVAASSASAASSGSPSKSKSHKKKKSTETPSADATPSKNVLPAWLMAARI